MKQMKTMRSKYIAFHKEYVTLRDLVNVQFGASRREINLAKKNLDDRLAANEKVQDYRSAQQNEWRGVVNDTISVTKELITEMKSLFVPRAEYEAKHEKTCQDIQDLREFRVKLDAKASVSAVNIGYILSIAGILLGLVSLIREFIK